MIFTLESFWKNLLTFMCLFLLRENILQRFFNNFCVDFLREFKWVCRYIISSLDVRRVNIWLSTFETSVFYHPFDRSCLARPDVITKWENMKYLFFADILSSPSLAYRKIQLTHSLASVVKQECSFKNTVTLFCCSWKWKCSVIKYILYRSLNIFLSHGVIGFRLNIHFI